MKIHIEDSSTTAEIKEKFSTFYPFLKLEFYTKAHKDNEGSKREDLIAGIKEIKDIRTVHNEGDFIITPSSTVTEVEQGFETLFGVHVQVFRKSGRLWLETTATDSWSLKEQNEVGMDMES